MVYRKEERGFLLLEVVIAGFSLMVLILGLRLYPQAVRRDAAESCRAKAVFLARGQMESLRACSAEGKIKVGEVPWLGRAEDLQPAAGVTGPDGSCRFSVSTEISPADKEANPYSVKITVHWDGSVDEGEICFWGHIENAKQMEKRL